ncbi:RagB/SusD family nutrient uptake outer membrane protein [Niabella insulamsoli]|uniref:RagB/SusD family nutrient uptake outer membrane protein n=1 Tax=Niabella insulamsoli TaxID=3144874 RepID=UPI0031FE04E2
MKKNSTILYIIAFAVTMCFSACVKSTLDKKPTLSFFEDNAFQTFDLAQTYSFGFYTAFDGYDLAHINNEWNADLVMNNSAAQGSNWIWNRMTIPTSDPLWNFATIRRVNIMLKNIDNSLMTEEEVNHWKSIGYFFRAFDYYAKIAAFGDVPWIDQVVTEQDENLLFGERTPRDVVANNMLTDLLFAETHIMEPGTKGIVPNSVGVGAVRALISRFGLFEGTWRKYHGLGDANKFLQASADASKKLIDANPELHPNYDEVFNSESLAGVKGIILYKQYDQGVLTHVLTSRHKNSAGNWDVTKKGADSYLLQDGKTRWNSPLFTTDKNPYDEFRNRDRRMLYTIVPPFRVNKVSGNQLAFTYTSNPADREYIDLFASISDERHKSLPSRNWAGQVLNVSPHFRDFNEGVPFNVSRTGYFTFKYYNRFHDIQNQDFSDAPIFRMGEVLVNYAEAMFELGQFNQAVADLTINKLRARGAVAAMKVAEITAGFDPTRDPEVDPVLWEIRRERGVELMLEGFRFDDLRRWKKMSYASEEKLGRWIKKSDYGNKLKTQDNAAEGYIVNFGKPPAFPDYYYLYPVPSNQIVLNPKIQQNPGWK